jgi:hypothetical protein
MGQKRRARLRKAACNFTRSDTPGSRLVARHHPSIPRCRTQARSQRLNRDACGRQVSWLVYLRCVFGYVSSRAPRTSNFVPTLRQGTMSSSDVSCCRARPFCHVCRQPRPAGRTNWAHCGERDRCRWVVAHLLFHALAPANEPNRL